VTRERGGALGEEGSGRRSPPQDGKSSGGSGGEFEYIDAETVSNVAPAAASQRNSCEMSRRYKREQNLRPRALLFQQIYAIDDDSR